MTKLHAAEKITFLGACTLKLKQYMKITIYLESLYLADILCIHGQYQKMDKIEQCCKK